MYTILQELYYGNIKPVEQPHLRSRLQEGLHQDYDTRMGVVRDALKNTDPDLLRELDLAIEKLTSIYSLEDESMFATGFTLGCRMMLEVMEHGWT